MTNRKTRHLVTLALAGKDWWWMLCAGKEGIPHLAKTKTNTKTEAKTKA